MFFLSPALPFLLRAFFPPPPRTFNFYLFISLILAMEPILTLPFRTSACKFKTLHIFNPPPPLPPAGSNSGPSSVRRAVGVGGGNSIHNAMLLRSGVSKGGGASPPPPSPRIETGKMYKSWGTNVRQHQSIRLLPQSNMYKVHTHNTYIAKI